MTNLPRIVLITVLVLSLLIVAKSFVAAYNVERWADDLQRMFATEQAEAGKRSYPIAMYLERLEQIQREWSVMRYVSVALAALSGYGIYLVSRHEKRHASNAA